MLELFDDIVRRVTQGETVALCVLARARGSTPQKTGAMMLVLADGNTLGTLGGGCVEAETRARAIESIHNRQSRLIDFKLDHDYGWDDGMVCGGMMDIAILIYSGTSSIERIKTCRDLLRARIATTFVIELGGSRFEIPIEPGPMLILAGAGHVARSVAWMAQRVGFDLIVIDDRPDMANLDRFPGARCVVGPIDLELSRQTIDPQTYVLIVTRGHKNDAHALAAVIRSNAKYIGMIGSKRKIRTILAGLFEEGIPREAIGRVHAPVGLSIGAITPDEIAISILAELISTRRGATETGPMKIKEDDLTKWIERENNRI